MHGCLQVFFARPDAKRHAGEACPGEKAMPFHVVKPPLRTMLARCAVPTRLFIFTEHAACAVMTFSALQSNVGLFRRVFRDGCTVAFRTVAAGFRWCKRGKECPHTQCEAFHNRPSMTVRYAVRPAWQMFCGRGRRSIPARTKKEEEREIKNAQWPVARWRLSARHARPEGSNERGCQKMLCPGHRSGHACQVCVRDHGRTGESAGGRHDG